MKLPHPFRRVDRWYARNFVCPQWGCKPAEEPWWQDSDGMVAVLGRVSRWCENCGEEIRDDT